MGYFFIIENLLTKNLTFWHIFNRLVFVVTTHEQLSHYSGAVDTKSFGFESRINQIFFEDFRNFDLLTYQNVFLTHKLWKFANCKLWSDPWFYCVFLCLNYCISIQTQWKYTKNAIIQESFHNLQLHRVYQYIEMCKLIRLIFCESYKICATKHKYRSFFCFYFQI